MKKFFIILSLLCHSLIIVLADHAFSETTEETNKIIWLKSNYPPYYILNGKNAGRGIADRIERLLQNELTQYEHDSVVANWRRILQEMKSGKNVVCLTLLKTPERQAYIEYSILTTVKPTNGICVRSDDPMFKDLQLISLQKLIKTKNLRIGIMHGRSYGKEIDRILEKDVSRQSVFLSTSSDGVEGLIQLLVRKRIDAIICYPHESHASAQQLGLQDKIKQLRVIEQEPLNLSYSGAPKTAWGKKIINEINKIYQDKQILWQTSLELEPYLDASTASWYREEVRKLIGQD